MGFDEVFLGAEMVPKIALGNADLFGDTRRRHRVIAVLVEETEARHENAVLGFGGHDGACRFQIGVAETPEF